MRDGHAVFDDACGELLASLALEQGPVLTVPLSADMSGIDANSLVEDLAARAGPGLWRALHVGAGVVALGIGCALTVATVDAIAPTIAAAFGRLAFLAVPFSASPPSSSSPSAWARHRARVAVVPRLWLHLRDGRATMGVDLGDDDGRGRREARALLQSMRRGLPHRFGGMLEVLDVSVVPERREHAVSVSVALQHMERSGLEKVVLGRRRRLHIVGEPGDIALDLWRAGAASSPEEVRFLVGDGDDALVGVTPERLCRRRGRKLDVDILAGTGPRDHDGLLTDDKERREHEAVRRFVVDILGPLTTAIDAPTTPGIRRLRGLQHLSTPVSATLIDAAPVFSLLHPTPAVAGVPRPAAMALIGAIEGFDRGLYAGVVGVADADGEDLQVALRCAHVRAGAGSADLDIYVGSGLVAGSVAAQEWSELDRKERTMVQAIDALVARRATEVARGAA